MSPNTPGVVTVRKVSSSQTMNPDYTRKEMAKQERPRNQGSPPKPLVSVPKAGLGGNAQPAGESALEVLRRDQGFLESNRG